MRALTLLLLALAACAAAAADDTPPSPPYAYLRVYASFDDDNTSLTLVPAPPAPRGDAPYEPPGDAVAWGEYAPASASPSGTGVLHVATSGAASDADQMTAAGMVEGYLTAREIADYYQNTWTYFTSPTGLNASLGSADDASTPLGWLATQDAWARSRAASTRTRRDTRWSVIGLLLAQLDGLVDGYAAAVAESEKAATRGHAAHPKLPPLSSHQLRFLNANGDLYDVIEHCRRYGGGKVGETAILPQLLASRPTYTRLATAGRCSAIVAVAPDLSDIFVGHSVWDSFSQATKVFKHVSTALATGGVPLTAQRLSYSSFPGELSSDDDLYMTPRLIIASTSLHIVNPDIYRTLPPSVLLSWQRVRAATLLARDGRDWARLFSEDNSGTYNNEFLILTPSSFAPGTDAPLRPGLLTVVDQIPGLVTTVDATRALDRGFFPSYNLPSNSRVYDKCGLNDEAAVAAVAGALDLPLAATLWLSYQAAPRASIFRRDGGGIGSVARLRQVMRSVYVGGAGDKATTETTAKPPAPLDPLAHGDALAAVCGRADLGADAATREPRGCFDSKATSVSLARELIADVVTGPSTAGGLLPPFKPADWAHVMPTAGMPDVWNFDWERTRPRLVARGGGVEVGVA